MFASLGATRAMAQCKLLTNFRCSGLLDFEGSGYEYTRALLAVLESCPNIVDVEAHRFAPSNSMNRVLEADSRAMSELLSNGTHDSVPPCRHASPPVLAVLLPGSHTLSLSRARWRITFVVFAEKLRLRSLTLHLADATFAPLLAVHTGLESLRVVVPGHVMVAATAADAALEPPFAALGQALARLTALRALAVQMEAEDGVAAARAEPWRLPKSLTKLVRVLCLVPSNAAFATELMRLCGLSLGFF
jgi:hypothetical protein